MRIVGVRLNSSPPAPFPEGYAATVHFQWAENPEWKLLGLYEHPTVDTCPIQLISSRRLSNEKPSAIFKLKGNIAAAQPGSATTAHIGIMCETLDVVQTQIATLQPSANQGALVPAHQRTSGDNALQIATHVAKNFLNYVSSFASNVPTHSSLHAILDPSAQNALIGMCDRWYKGLESKTRNGVDWLNKQQD